MTFFYFLGKGIFRKIEMRLKEIFQCFQTFARFPNQYNAHHRMKNRAQPCRASSKIYFVNYLRMICVNLKMPDARRKGIEKRRLIE